MNAAANRALQPPGAKLSVLETGVEIALAQEPIAEPAEPSAEHAGVAGAPADRGGGKIPKGVFVAVTEVEPEHVRLDNGLRLKQQELLRATRLSHAVTYASSGWTWAPSCRVSITANSKGCGAGLPFESQCSAPS